MEYCLTLCYAKHPRSEHIVQAENLDKAIAIAVVESRTQLKPIGIIWDNPLGRTGHRMCRSGLKTVDVKEFDQFNFTQTEPQGSD